MRRILPQREAYRYWAESFDQGTPILALEARALAPFLLDVRGKRFLDIGCGTGRWLKWAVDQGARAFGADLSMEMLREASRKPEAAAHIVQAEASATPFRDASAEIVLSALVVGHVRPVSAAMNELSRIAAPGALVLVTDFHPDALRKGWKRTFKHQGDTIEMESDSYSLAELAHEDLVLEQFREIAFGDEERHFFEAAGKLAWFEENQAQPAIVIASFRRRK